MAKKKKISTKQKREKYEKALEREKRAKKKQSKNDLRKRIFTIIVCVVLVAGLSIPTLALTVCKATS